MDIDPYVPTATDKTQQRLSGSSDQIGDSVVILTGAGSPALVTELSDEEVRMMANLLEELCAALPGEAHENLRSRTRAIINVFWDIKTGDSTHPPPW